MNNDTVCATTLTLADELGWHLRPVALLVKLAGMFDSDIMAERGEQAVSARSLFGVVTLCAAGGKHLRVTARGHDAKDAIKAIESGFSSSVQVEGARRGSAPPAVQRNGGEAQSNGRKECKKGVGMTVRKTIAKLTGRGKTAATMFTCALRPKAKRVFVAGDFNGWDSQADAMTRRNGRFVKSITLAPGEYQYKFVIDGEWHADPAAPTIVNDQGTLNNVVSV